MWVAIKKKIKNGKLPVPDCVLSELLKKLTRNCSPFLDKLFKLPVQKQLLLKTMVKSATSPHTQEGKH